MPLTLPFAHLNLRWNPFGELESAERARLAVVDGSAVALGEVLQFIGESGRGKTTHLLALAACYPEARYERLDLGQTQLRGEVASGSMLLIDEAQRLDQPSLRQVARSAHTLVLGTHEDLSQRVDRPVRTVRLAGLSRAKLRAIVERRITWARRGPGPIPVVSDDAICTLIGCYGDDLRAIEGRLYEVFQSLREPGNVQV